MSDKKPAAVDHFVEWLKHSNKALKAPPSSPIQKEHQASAAFHLAESKKNPAEHERRMSAMTGVKKSNYGPKGAGQYTAADNAKRKQGNANEVVTAPGNVKIKTGANASGEQGKSRLNREVAEARRKTKANKPKSLSPEQMKEMSARLGVPLAPGVAEQAKAAPKKDKLAASEPDDNSFMAMSNRDKLQVLKNAKELALRKIASVGHGAAGSPTSMAGAGALVEESIDGSYANQKRKDVRKATLEQIPERLRPMFEKCMDEMEKSASEPLRKEYDEGEGKPIHGLISPTGEYHELGPKERHNERLTAITGLPEKEALEAGWVMAGHAGGPAHTGPALANPRHPATARLRQLMTEHGHDVGDVFINPTSDHSSRHPEYEADAFARHGRLVPNRFMKADVGGTLRRLRDMVRKK